MTVLTVLPGLPYRLGEGDTRVSLALKDIAGDPPVAVLGVVRHRRTVEQSLSLGDRIELGGTTWTVTRVDGEPEPRLDLEEAT